MHGAPDYITISFCDFQSKEIPDDTIPTYDIITNNGLICGR